MADAAALGVARDPVLSARADPDLSAGLPAPAVADLRWLFGRRRSRAQLGLRLGRVPARAAARALDYSGLDWRLGAWHARHDGHDDWRRLRPLCRGERPEGFDCVPPVLCAQCGPAPGHRTRLGARPDLVRRGAG